VNKVQTSENSKNKAIAQNISRFGDLDSCSFRQQLPKFKKSKQTRSSFVQDQQPKIKKCEREWNN
jgi:hypothetical protein